MTKRRALDAGVTRTGVLDDSYLERMALGTWIPNVDLCETREAFTIRVEVPGVDLHDLQVTISNNVVRVRGIKREPEVSRNQLLCYYCVERRYGRFEREIPVDGVIDAHRGRAALQNGILTIEVPRLVERRGSVYEIKVVRKHE